MSYKKIAFDYGKQAFEEAFEKAQDKAEEELLKRANSEETKVFIATKLNKRINLPILNESQEQHIFEKATGLFQEVLQMIIKNKV